MKIVPVLAIFIAPVPNITKILCLMKDYKRYRLQKIMNSLENNEVAINLVLLKTLRILHIFDPNSPKIFNYNVFRLASVVALVISQCIALCGLFGLISGSELSYNMDSLTVIQFMNTYIMCFQGILKTVIFSYNADKIWDLLDLSRINFLKSKKCQSIRILYSYRKVSIILTNFIAYFGLVIIIMWTMFPLCINVFNLINSDISISRYENIFNLLYPVTLSVYNQNYFLFYFMEAIVNVFCGYVIIQTNVILVTFFLVIIPQYEILFTAFENLGHKYDFQNGDKSDVTQCYDDFISLLDDQQRTYIKLQTFYNVMKPILLMTVIITSGVIILFCVPITQYLFDPLSKGASLLNVIKIFISTTFLVVELFVYCYLLDNVTTKKESVSFGMYCCNWTEMDMKFKKLLLLSMRINDAENLKIKATPLRVVNLMLFSSVMTTTYNIVSVLLNTLL